MSSGDISQKIKQIVVFEDFDTIKLCGLIIFKLEMM